jgi:protein-disulfide isomerase
VQPTLAALREKYGPDDLRIVWKNNPLPFHQNARPAAIAAMGVFDLAGPDAFWKFHDSLFSNQASLDQPSFERWATAAGVTDLDALRAGIASNRWVDPVDADARDAKSLGAPGTPAFFINGVFVNGAQPFEKFKAIVDQELAKAQAKLDAGTPRELLYAQMARENRAAAPKPTDEDSGPPEDTTTVFKIPVGTSPVRGKATALVTMVEFADFQCPFSGRVQKTLDAIRAKYGDKIRIVWKNEPLPFHKNAEPAAQAAFEVRAEKGDAAFWAMHDKLFAGQKDLSADVVVAMAVQLGASEAKVRAAMSGHTHAKEIDADGDLAEDFHAFGTPNFFIDGRHLVGAQPEAKFDKIIDEEIDKAQALVSRGTPPSGVYAALVKAGKGPTPFETKDVPSSLPSADPARGNLGARVVVHEFADFQCPFCGRAEPTLADVMKTYGNRIKLVWHDLPLPMHADAPLAAQAAREAYKQKGAAGFWTLHDKLFANQQHIKRDDLDGYARDMGLDMSAWAAALDGSAHGGEIRADEDAAGAASISGTPAFLVVSGSTRHAYFISGAQPYEKFRRVIERALSEAR